MSLKNGLYIRLGNGFPAPYIETDEIGSVMITIVINNVKAKSCIYRMYILIEIMNTIHIEIIDIYMDNVFMYFGHTKYGQNRKKYTSMRIWGKK